MKTKNFAKGRLGENIAKAYLQKKSYKFVEANFLIRGGEIDLIMIDNNCLVFVEVKLKIGVKFGRPEEMISRNKISTIKKTAKMFLIQNPLLAKMYDKVRIDAVCIEMKNNKEINWIKHYQNIDI